MFRLSFYDITFMNNSNVLYGVRRPRNNKSLSMIFSILNIKWWGAINNLNTMYSLGIPIVKSDQKNFLVRCENRKPIELPSSVWKPKTV